MAVSGTFVTHELDEMLVQYRKQLEHLGPLFAHASELGVGRSGPVLRSSMRSNSCAMTSKTCTETLLCLEQAVTSLMDKCVAVERAKQEVLDLKASLDISRQMVETKSHHLGQEEKQKEQEQDLKFKEFKAIHRFQDEKVAFEKELAPAKRRLTQLSEVLEEKGAKMRNLENFYEALYEHCEAGMDALHRQTAIARTEKPKWDRFGLDIGQLVRDFPLDNETFQDMGNRLNELTKTLQHHKQWYEDEMQTKLFYSTRSKEIKNKLAYFRSVLRRMESSGRSEAPDEDACGNRLGRRSENILVDGSPGVDAKEVEGYLSRQFGMRVLADYTMLKRLKDEIGVQGLAYLVEKVRLQQGSVTPTTAGIISSGPAFADWEEQRLEQALKGIAMEYRDSEESKSMLQPVASGMSLPMAYSPSQTAYPTKDEPHTHNMSPASTLPNHASSTATPPGGRDSNSSLKRKSSLARLRKMFKF